MAKKSARIKETGLLSKRLSGYSEAAASTLSLDSKSRSARRLGYSAAGAAAALALTSLVPNGAVAAPQTYTPTSPITVTSGSSYNLNIDSWAAADFRFRVFSTTSSYYIARVSGINYSTNVIAGTASRTGLPNNIYARRFSASNTIVPSYFSSTTVSSYSTSTRPATGRLLAYSTTSTSGGSFRGTRGFLGVQFEKLAASTHYGWIDLAVSADASTITIYAWGWDDGLGGSHIPNLAATPEPASLALLAMGAGGVVAWRKRRKKAPARNS